MKGFTNTENPIIIRTDFSDEEAWQKLTKRVSRSNAGFIASVNFLSDPRLEKKTKNEILSLIPKHYDCGFVMIADETTFSSGKQLLLIVDLLENVGKDFRAPPEQIQSIENNLSTANMDFSELARAVGRDGVFRGFR